MTLTELRYIVAVAREGHFGRAAEACFVSQPTLSVGVHKLEKELGVTLFERGTNEVGITPVGRKIIAQAQRAIEEAAAIKTLAQQGRDPLCGPLRLGFIYTVGPYLLPYLTPVLRKRAPAMPLIIEENITAELAEFLLNGELDAIVVSLPFDETAIITEKLYDEAFVVLLPKGHALERKAELTPRDVVKEDSLLLTAGHCFRDQVLDVCRKPARGDRVGSVLLEGSSLETIRHMVAFGLGVAVVPCSALAVNRIDTKLLSVRPFAEPVPKRRVALAWRKSFHRPQAVAVVRDAIRAWKLPCLDTLAD
ncbi:MAG: hydrogen peroxide-inducible genes activator [Burkholderiales bacterium]